MLGDIMLRRLVTIYTKMMPIMLSNIKQNYVKTNKFFVSRTPAYRFSGNNKHLKKLLAIKEIIKILNLIVTL